MEYTVIADFVKEMRRQFGLTQVDLADKSGVGLRFVRDLEQGKQTLRMDKVNQVLSLFGRQVGPVELSPKSRDCMTAWQADWWKTKTDSPLHTTQII